MLGPRTIFEKKHELTWGRHGQNSDFAVRYRGQPMTLYRTRLPRRPICYQQRIQYSGKIITSCRSLPTLPCSLCASSCTIKEMSEGAEFGLATDTPLVT